MGTVQRVRSPNGGELTPKVSLIVAGWEHSFTQRPNLGNLACYQAPQLNILPSIIVDSIVGKFSRSAEYFLKLVHYAPKFVTFRHG